MIHRKWFRLAVCLCITIYFGWMFLRQARLEEARDALSEVNVVWLIAAASALGAGYSFRIQRWRQMLALDNAKVTWWACAGPFLGSFAVNNLVPFRTGDILRSLAFKESLGSSSGVVLATLFVERLLDLLMLLVFLLVMLAVFGFRSGPVAGIASSMLIGSLVAIVALLAFPSILNPLLQCGGSLALRFIPGFGQKIVDEIHRSLVALEHMATGRTMSRLIGWSLLAWTAEGGVFWCTAQSVPSVTAPEAAWLAFPVGSLAVLLPGAPGEVGTFHYFVGRAMIEMGNSPAAAVAYALFAHAIMWVATTVVGVPCLYFALRRERSLRHLTVDPQALKVETAPE